MGYETRLGGGGGSDKGLFWGSIWDLAFYLVWIIFLNKNFSVDVMGIIKTIIYNVCHLLYCSVKWGVGDSVSYLLWLRFVRDPDEILIPNWIPRFNVGEKLPFVPRSPIASNRQQTASATSAADLVMSSISKVETYVLDFAPIQVGSLSLVSLGTHKYERMNRVACGRVELFNSIP